MNDSFYKSIEINQLNFVNNSILRRKLIKKKKKKREVYVYKGSKIYWSKNIYKKITFTEYIRAFAVIQYLPWSDIQRCNFYEKFFFS